MHRRRWIRRTWSHENIRHLGDLLDRLQSADLNKHWCRHEGHAAPEYRNADHLLFWAAVVGRGSQEIADSSKLGATHAAIGGAAAISFVKGELFRDSKMAPDTFAQSMATTYQRVRVGYGAQ